MQIKAVLSSWNCWHLREQLQQGMWTSPVHFCRVFALKSNENTLGQELWIIMVCNYKMIRAHHNQLCKLANYGKKKKANQPWTKINTLSGACIIFPLSLCKSVIYIYVSKSRLKCWVPPFLIAQLYRKWTHFQMCWEAAIRSGVSGTWGCSANLN